MLENSIRNSLKFHLFNAFIARLLLIMYAAWHDSNMEVKYTDVDYSVFTDAAEFVWKNDSPYRRSTYRYTPIIAWILVPNIFAPVFGKIIFSSLDILCGALIYAVVRSTKDHNTSLKMSYFWLYNPLSIAISTRGSVESVLVALVLSVFYLISKDQINLAAFIYGLSVHTKIYPVTFCLPIYMFLGEVDYSSVRRFIVSVAPGKKRWSFGIIAMATFLVLTSLFYWCYGEEFLDETYLYHIRRKDTIHNFSPYFYLLYLAGESEWTSRLGLLFFLPQLFLLVLVSVYLYKDLPLCCFLQTLLFVTYNKVCTSQYLVWYLCLVPIVAPRIRMTGRRGGLLLAAWFAGQGLWLLPAYLLEFQGQPTFLYIWCAGLIFFTVNIIIAGEVIVSYEDETDDLFVLYESRDCSTTRTRKWDLLSLLVIISTRWIRMTNSLHRTDQAPSQTPSSLQTKMNATAGVELLKDEKRYRCIYCTLRSETATNFIVNSEMVEVGKTMLNVKKNYKLQKHGSPGEVDVDEAELGKIVDKFNILLPSVTKQLQKAGRNWSTAASHS